MTDTIASSVTFDRTQGKYVAMCDGIVVTKTKSIKRAQRLLKLHLSGLRATVKQQEAEGLSFSVADRFSFVEALTEMVAKGKAPSAIVTGEGGIGKTFTITKVLRDNGFLPSDDPASVHLPASKVYVIVKGYSTPYALYRTLFENQDRVVLFDDCDSVLSDATAINLLKAALDSYSKRTVSWQSEVKGSDLPNSFTFNGGVIFISNYSLSSLNQAVRSRALCVDLSMNANQKLERMSHLVQDAAFLPELSIKVKTDALAVIRDNIAKVKSLNLRTLIQVAKIRATDRKDWTKLAMYVISQ